MKKFRTIALAAATVLTVGALTACDVHDSDYLEFQTVDNGHGTSVQCVSSTHGSVSCNWDAYNNQ